MYWKSYTTPTLPLRTSPPSSMTKSNLLRMSNELVLVPISMGSLWILSFVSTEGSQRYGVMLNRQGSSAALAAVAQASRLTPTTARRVDLNRLWLIAHSLG